MNRYLIPGGVFVILLVFLFSGLRKDSRDSNSAYHNKLAPAFQIPDLITKGKQLSLKDFKGKIVILNFWASWCAACHTEHPVLMALSKDKRVTMIGIAYKNASLDALKFLKKFGNPFELTGLDSAGNAGLEFGVSKVPETFVIDKSGIVRYKHLGPINWVHLKTKILPLVEELDKQPVANR